jgi:protein subunit release factor A
MSDLIPPDELRVTSYPERPKGGQHVGMDYGVKVEHLPTGLIAIVNVGRSQHKHREMAVHMIEAALTHPKWRLV